MTRIGAFEAKTKLSALLDRVMQGETVEITRRGKTVARLIPALLDHKDRVADAIHKIQSLRKGVRLGGLSIRRMIGEGRR